MEDLQIRWRWLNQTNPMPAVYAFDCVNMNNHFELRAMRQIDVVINRFRMVECDMNAFASGVLLARRLLGFAASLGRAAALLTPEHKELFAGDAATPE